jgi:two-component system, OmpR family, response regulator QseB
MSRILIAEDNARLAQFLDDGLRAHGFTTTVVGDGRAAALMASDEDFDLLILDLGLPGLDGLAVLRDIRGRAQRLPTIVLTARDDVADKVAGLEGGADDYVTKPFRFEELLARVRARLRTVREESGTSLLRHVGDLVLDPRTRRVSCEGHPVELSAREFTLLDVFMRHPGQVLTREQLLSHVWGYAHDPTTNVVDVYVGYLRKKLGARRIQTVYGVGYRLMA